MLQESFLSKDTAYYYGMYIGKPYPSPPESTPNWDDTS